MGLLGAAELLGAVVVLFALCLVGLALRQRWLTRQGGTFACSLRLGNQTPSYGWALGLGRYNQGTLEWFRFFSYAARPRLRLLRADVRLMESRDPDLVEAVSLGAEQKVLKLVAQAPDRPAGEYEFAMSPDSLTGLLSWLEAAPPGPASRV